MPGAEVEAAADLEGRFDDGVAGKARRDQNRSGHADCSDCSLRAEGDKYQR